jgi:UDP-N-acetyl-D-glucosamine dehydrogenase
VKVIGLPLAVEFARAGFEVTGIDVSQTTADRVNRGDSYVGDVLRAVLKPLVESENLRATSNFFSRARPGRHQHLRADALAQDQGSGHEFHRFGLPGDVRYFHTGLLVILESTTYPGTTDEVVLPMLSKSGLKAGEEFFLCFSPSAWTLAILQTANIPKVVGDVTKACTEMGRLFYSQALERVVPVSSTQVAEMVKLLENTFRMINIGLANEIALMCDRMAINVWEVIDTASTKPFGFMPFYPGPGLGLPLHSDRPVLPVVEDQAGWHRSPLHRTGRIDQRADAALCIIQGAERAERRGQAAQGFARPSDGGALQAQHRRCARIARARPASFAGTKGRRGKL